MTQTLSSWSLGKRLVQEFAWRYWKAMALGLVCMITGAASTAFLAKLLQPIFDDVFINKNQEMLTWVAVATLFVFASKGGSGYGETYFLSFVSQKMMADIKQRLFKHLLTLDLQFFHDTPSGDLNARLNSDVALVNSAVTETLTGMGKDFLTLVFLIALMFHQDPFLAMISFVVFPLAVLPILKIGKRIRKTSTTVQEDTARFMTTLSEVFQGVRVVKSYGCEAYEGSRVDALTQRIFQTTLKGIRVKARTHPIMEMLGGIAIVTIISYGGSEVIAGNRTTGSFISFITALLFLYEPLKRLANLNASLQERLAAAQRIFHVLDLRPHIQDSPEAKPLRIKEGTLKFENISFSYGDKKVLKEVSFEAPKGHTIALVGSSGAGKSTLMNLIPRFYDVSTGRILIDSQDIREVTLGSLRANIALVSQEVMLFNDSIYNNIAYGLKGVASFEAIESAAKSAGAHDFIVGLPEGYQTVVGELGVKLSGGQRQRISIARAILKNAPILLLDEATSALDTESERHVQEALKILMKGRTTITIAHRLSTIQEAHQIYVMEHGKIVEHGTHQELLKLSKRYAKLAKVQEKSHEDLS